MQSAPVKNGGRWESATPPPPQLFESFPKIFVNVFLFFPLLFCCCCVFSWQHNSEQLLLLFLVFLNWFFCVGVSTRTTIAYFSLYSTHYDDCRLQFFNSWFFFLSSTLNFLTCSSASSVSPCFTTSDTSIGSTFVGTLLLL